MIEPAHSINSNSLTKLSPLTPETLALGLTFLSERDPDLAHILQTFGPPPLWLREPGFPTLVHIILEQQVSLASALAAYNRLLEAVSPLTPEGLLQLDDASLKTIGFSRQKTGYVRFLAEAIVEGRLNLPALHNLEDAAVKTELLKLKGIGNWTSDIYLMMALGRPDIWPKGDLALILAVQRVKRLPSKPSNEELEIMSKAWQPWRAVAARLFWHYYLSSPSNRIQKSKGALL